MAQAHRGKHAKKKHIVPGSWMVVLLCTTALIYFLARIIMDISGGMVTVSATHVTVDDAITATGCFIREETVIAGAAGDTVEHVVHSGEKVFAGARLAVEYTDQAALETNLQINSLTQQIELLQAAMQSVDELADTARLDQLISIQMQSFAQQTNDGMLNTIEETSTSLRQLILQRGVGGQDAQMLQTEITQLQQQRDHLQNVAGAKTNVITAPDEGYFSGIVDGYENICTVDNIEKLTEGALKDMLSQQPQPDHSALGKVVKGFEWYFATIIPKQDAEGLKEQRNYTLRFSQLAQDVKATLYVRRTELGSDNTLLVFKSNVISSELVSMRNQVVDIVKDTHSGIKIPKSAIRMSGNDFGVFTLSGNVSRFKKVIPIYEGDTFFVVEQGNRVDNTGVVVQDDIIVKARGLEDNKVVK